MFESFMLDRLAHIALQKKVPLAEDAEGAEEEIDFLQASNSEMSMEFRALKSDLQKKLSAPVSSGY